MAQNKYQKKHRKRKQNRLIPVILGLGGLALLVFAVLALRGGNRPKAAIEVKGSPSVKVDKEEIDFGDVKLGQTVEASFTVTNVGDQTLRFNEQPYIEVKEGCWPPEVTVGSMVIQPGESTTLSMQFMMHGDMGGKHDFRVHLPTNDPEQPDRTLAVLSNWVP